ncbi:glycoside hydrolase family 92 protein [Daldinia caldariorum]|uniref:glycoside hydrolase family 92 protein n=1 Tax=Daldinia caldariorum TaxID=326644 RepID=UPI002007FC19|nr:glycoside hydrolase family 92 protein [Daldinia caldariorum]KAI1473101.1 glycoside hydrolase family 92 protein [Daldinia caldariorum]
MDPSSPQSDPRLRPKTWYQWLLHPRRHIESKRESDPASEASAGNSRFSRMLFLKSLPRWRRFLIVVPIVGLLVWVSIPNRLNSPNTLLQTIKGSSWKYSDDILRYVDPLIGTVNGGHVFPGATLPYGMAKAVADTSDRGEIAAGFVSDDSDIQGFSHLHDSGTGGSPSLGNFPLFVHPGCPEDDFAQCKYTYIGRGVPRIKHSATARPGYFAISLNNSVHAEMTATEHATLYRFSLPKAAEVLSHKAMVPTNPLLLLDLMDLGNSRTGGDIQVNPETGRITGNGSFSPSFGRGSYTAHVCADFRGADIRKTGVFLQTNVTDEIQAVGHVANNFYIPSGSAGAWIHFAHSEQIVARVGLSFISVQQACHNAEVEIPNFGFDDVVKAAEKAWRDKLSVIMPDHSGMSHEFLTTFWSGLYRALISPQDYTGENQLWESNEPYYDSFYCIWDSFRAQHPLLTIVDPKIQTKMVRSLIDIYKHEGKLPDCRMSFSKGYTQGGSNADVVLADAFIKNLTDGIDWNLGYEAVVSDAEVEPKDWSTTGRGSLVSWHTLGYVPYDDQDKNGTGPMSRGISRTVEYAYDDFVIALMARGLGHKNDETKYLQRSRNWKNLFNPEQEDRYRDEAGTVQMSTFKGFLQPRFRNGTWRYQNTRLCSPIYQQHSCYFDTQYETYEGSPWLYTFYVPQDMAALIEALGGHETFVERLDFFHSSGINYMGNEPNFLTTFQFHYAGRPGRSNYWLHQYIPGQFNSSINGIPGNDDCAMGAFTAFAFMGFYPVAGQDVYLLTAPMFRQVSIQTPSGKPAILRNVGGFDAPQYRNIYVQRVRLNGKSYTRNWIKHDFFLKGGTLEFVLGPTESDWGTRNEDLPPSLSTGLPD